MLRLNVGHTAKYPTFYDQAVGYAYNITSIGFFGKRCYVCFKALQLKCNNKHLVDRYNHIFL